MRNTQGKWQKGERVDIDEESLVVLAFKTQPDLERVTFEFVIGAAIEYWKPPVLEGGDGQ